MGRHFIRINDKFIRFDRIKSIETEEWFTTDSMAIINISFSQGPTEKIFLLSDEWLSGKDAEDYFRPKIKAVTDFIEKAIKGDVQEYFIEV